MKSDNRNGAELSHVAQFFNPYAPIQRHSHRLPHWQQGAVHYFVTWRLADSLPTEKLARWSEERNLWLGRHPQPWSRSTELEFQEKFVDSIDDWLDAGEGSCVLRHPQHAMIVANAFLYFDNRRYVINSFVVMPNHVHVLFRIIEPNRLEDLVKSWKGLTAREINRRLQRCGALWQPDYWDRLVRDEAHLLKCRNYIRTNPAKASLSETQYVLFMGEMEESFPTPC